MRKVAAGLALLAFGCGSSDNALPGASGGGHGGRGEAGAATDTAGRDDSGGGMESGGGPSVGRPGTLATVAMPLINHKTPVFGSDGPQVFRGPQDANDGEKTSAWEPLKLPAWVAFDVSAAPESERGQVLVVWNAPHAGGWIGAPVGKSEERPIDYTIETNAAPGGVAPPSGGWTEVAKVHDCPRGSFQHLIDLAGGNWLRMTVTKTSDPPVGVNIDVDIFSAPNGDTDSWLFMGDSITYMSTPYAFSDLPTLVQGLKPDRFPPIIDAAIGGTNTGTAILVIDETMRDFPGRFVTLNYGTNDHPSEFAMEPLVQHVLRAGKIPVVPHMPWSQGGAADGADINRQIDALYAKYPEILPGPDLYGVFEGHTEWIPVGDIHPNGDGQEQLRKAWAAVIAAVP